MLARGRSFCNSAPGVLENLLSGRKPGSFCATERPPLEEGMLSVRIASAVGVGLLLIATPALAASGEGSAGRAGFGLVNYIALAAYLAALVVIGAYFSRREKSTDDFFLAGRRIPWWAAGLSIFGTGLSAITYMAIPAKAYDTDWVFILSSFAPILFIPVVVAFYIPFYRRLGVTTAYEYLERRFNLAARLFASIFFILFQFGRMAIVLYLPAVALSTVTGLNVYACIVIMGVLATVYTVLGGIEAVIWTDVLQVVVLLGGAILSLVLIARGVDGGYAGIVSTGLAYGKFHTFNWGWGHTAATVWVVVLGSFLSAVMPNTADQSIVQRYLATRDVRSAKRAAWTSALMGIPTAFLFFFLGTALFVFYKAHPERLAPGIKSIATLPLFIMQEIPPGISGLLIAGIFAAAMSSVDSGMNSVATAFTTDFYRRFRRDAGERHYLRVARIVTLIAGTIAIVVAIAVARLEVQSLLDLFFEIMGLFGGSIAGLFVLGIFTRRANGAGALVGAGLSALVLYLAKTRTEVHFFLYGGIGLAVCVVIGYVASLASPDEPKDLTGLTIYTSLKEEGE